MLIIPLVDATFFSKRIIIPNYRLAAIEYLGSNRILRQEKVF